MTGVKDDEDDDEDFVDIETNNNNEIQQQPSPSSSTNNEPLTTINENLTTIDENSLVQPSPTTSTNGEDDGDESVNEELSAISSNTTQVVADDDNEHNESKTSQNQTASDQQNIPELGNACTDNTDVVPDTVSTGSGERKLSCVSVEVDEVNVIESVEELEAVQEITITESSSVTDDDDVTVATAGVVDPNSLAPGGAGDLNFKLESVTEETEEELKADGSGRSPMMRRNRLTDSLLNTNQTQSLTDLPPIPPKRVGILKRAGAKKDRPLSDSFENLKMVENQGIIDLYHGQQSGLSPSPPPLISRGHSLDALMDRPDGGEMTSSQLSLAERCDSQDSLTGGSDCGDSSPKSRSRSGSGKSRSSSAIFYSNRASSLSLSLNDVQHISRTSSTSSTEDFHHHHHHQSLHHHKKKNGGSSLFRRFHNGKKAKSMSSLDHEENNLMSESG